MTVVEDAAYVDPEPGSPAGADEGGAEAPATRMPPGPPLPRLVQTLAFVMAGPRFLGLCRRVYGDAVTLSTLFDSRFVMVFDPGLTRELFQGGGGDVRLHAGEANALLGPILGERSVLLLDGAEHLRHRRLLLPPFHGARMRGWEETILRAADDEIDAWPVDEPFALLPSLQSLTLHVILEAVFGYAPGPAEEELAAALRAFVDPITEQGTSLGFFARVMWQRLRPGGRGGAGDAETEGSSEAAFLADVGSRRAAVDELLFAEIARRRGLGDDRLREREDVFSALLLAEDEDGVRLTDGEVRDELLTLLLAGHETTATGLAWAVDLLLHTPEVLARALAAAESGPAGDAYLDAVAKETLRIRPVIAGVGRVVRGGPFPLGEWRVPDGVEINPSIRMIHARADLYPEPAAFRPERFLGNGIDGAGVPDTYTWLPFGGGTRRCLGASFALMEMRLVLRQILWRTGHCLRAVSEEPEHAEFRAITLSPRHGTQVLLASH